VQILNFPEILPVLASSVHPPPLPDINGVNQTIDYSLKKMNFICYGLMAHDKIALNCLFLKISIIEIK